MTIKNLLFCLFLYVCLVWVAAAYFQSGMDFQRFGLLWTAAGLGAVLLFIVFGRLWASFRGLRTKFARPDRPQKKVLAVSEDETALAALLNEANAALQRSTTYSAPSSASPLSQFSFYLLIGPEGAGKTSTFLNSGLEPQLLAGRVTGAGPLLPTQFCNLWLARNCIFIEVAGRIFADPVRWNRLLRGLRTKPAIPAWRRLWQQPEREMALRGVVAFSEVKDLMAGITPQAKERTERQALDWQERLRAVAEVFERQVPAYLLITKIDTVPYFPDYFRRLRDPEITQVLGCTLPAEAHDNQFSADLEAKKLTRSFGPLYRSLAERRLLHLAQEPDVGRRSGIYEFPRELKRLRSSLVQFMVDVFRPNPLRPTAFLRGYYFTGTREGEALPVMPGSSVSLDDASVVDATILFRSDATQIFRPDDASRVTMQASAKASSRRWLFVSELFEKVILASEFPGTAAAHDPRVERTRSLIFVVVAGLCLLMCIAFLSSWAANAQLLDAVVQAEKLQGNGRDTSFAGLQSLESLRLQLSQLTWNERQGAPLRMRWGLYTGNGVLPRVKRLYFRRFQEALLNPLDGAMVSRLSVLPAVPGPNDPYEPIFSILKAHLTISSGSCKPEPALVSRVLRETLGQVHPEASLESRALAGKQIDTYSAELPFGNPCRLAENAAARDHARLYLQHIQGADRLYARILATGRQKFTKPIRLADLAANYRLVLNGQPEMDGIFSKDGWAFVEQAAQKGSGGSSADACVTGDTERAWGMSGQSPEMRRAIEQLYGRDYMERWRNFIQSFSVTRYSSAGDAARKLELLADHKSPLLAVFALTSNQTNFPVSMPEATGIDIVKPYIKKIFPGLKTPATTPNPPDASGQMKQSISGSATITRSFQPVHIVVPPGSETWVVDKNSPYVDSLAELSHAMKAIADDSSNSDPAIHQDAAKSYEKAIESARQIAKAFEPMGVNGLDMTVQHLLEAPIRMADGFIIHDPVNIGKKKVNGELHAFCINIRPLLHKYPFSQSGEDAKLEDVAAWFAPGTGGVWKFQAQTLGELTAKDGALWKAKDSPKMQATPEVITFLNRAETITGAFYANGPSQVQLSYTLRPKLDASIKDAVIELEVDGQRHEWTSTLQKQFTWPAAPLSKDLGARGRIRAGSFAFPFVSRGGLWGIFHAMGDAEPRALGSKLVEWKYVRSGEGRLEAIQPAPVTLEIVDFPGGADLFNPHFYEGLQCPPAAAQ